MTNGDLETRRRGVEFETHASPRLSVRAGARLSRFIIAKSILETLFVVALVAHFSYAHFNPRLRGSLDVADEREIAGWATDEDQPAKQIEVELYIDGHFVARRRADATRADVLAARRAADAEHGFVFQTPQLAPGEHEARVFAVHEGADAQRKTLLQIGNPKSFKIIPV